MTNSTIVERKLISHSAFVAGLDRLEDCFRYAAGKAEAEGIAVIAPSGAGKSTLLATLAMNHEPFRSPDGMVVPILNIRVPANPTVKSLQTIIINALGESGSQRGTEGEKDRQVRVLLKKTGNRMIMLDEFQHFYDRGTRRIMIHVTDWLKGLIDDTRSTIVVAGLPEAQLVIEENPQLERRFLAPIQLPQFDWANVDDREEFLGILKEFHNTIAQEFETPVLFSEEMGFRFWSATNGLIAYLVKLLRHALRKAAIEERNVIRLADFAIARKASIWLGKWPAGMPKPFDAEFDLVPKVGTLDLVRRMGKINERVQVPAPRSAKKPQKQSNHVLPRSAQ
jgi:hypothetical protein